MLSNDDKATEEDSEQTCRELVVSLNQVKSTAVVKYANVETPAWFQELQRNTNLNNPPSSWSRDSRSWEKYIGSMSGQEHLPFSSFNMAHCYPDLAGDVDVISDSEDTGWGEV